MDIFAWEDKYVTGETHVYEVTNQTLRDKADEIVESFKEAISKEKIALWGAGTVGRAFYMLLKELGVPVDYIIDKNGGDINYFPDEREVLAVSDEGLCETIQKATLIVATVNNDIFEDVKNDISEKGIRSRVICGHHLHMVARGALCMSKACHKEKKIILKNCYECTNLDSTCASLNEYLKWLNGFKDEGEGTKAVRMIGYALGNICTLKCRHCFEAVPYVPADRRRFIPGENVVRDIEKLSSACNFLTLLEFIGGEPFLHPDLPMILNHAMTIKNIGSIHVFTNGTVVPSDELCAALKNERITVYISNYQASLAENLIQKIKETEMKLERYGINYLFGRKQAWLDFSGFDLFSAEESEEELKQRFIDCQFHNCNRLHDGTLYICAHQYAGAAIGKLQEQGETIKIHEYSVEELGKKLEEMKRMEFIDACRYCPLPYAAKKVPSGEQL